MTATVALTRRPGSRSLAGGIVALPLGVALFVVLAAVGSGVPAIGDNPVILMLPVLLVLGGVVALVVGLVRRVLARS